MVQRRSRPRLTHEALARGRFGGQVRTHHLEGHRPLQPGIDGVENDAHAPLTQDLSYAILPKPAEVVGFRRRRQKTERLGKAPEVAATSDVLPKELDLV